MAMQRLVLILAGAGASLCMWSSAAWAADGGVAEAAQAGMPDATREQILQTIDATRHSDPELAVEMEHQLELMEAGDRWLGAGEQGGPAGVPDSPSDAAPGAGGIEPIFVGPPVDGGGDGGPSYMTPELRDELTQVFDGVARGDLSGEQARAQAEAILREHGVDPREVGPGHDAEHEGSDGDRWRDGFGDDLRGDNSFKDDSWGGARSLEGGEAGFERAFEQMSPEAREQMERLFEHEGERHGMDRELFEHELGAEQRQVEGTEHEADRQVSERETEAVERTAEVPERQDETPERASEAPERSAETPEREDASQAPEREDQMPEHQYEMPEHEGQPLQDMEHESSQPEPPPQ